MSRRISRRQAIAELLAGGVGVTLAAAGCGSSGNGNPGSGSTLETTWADPRGIGVLELAPGERLLARTDLAPAVPLTGTLVTLAHVTDAHILDASSPARVTFLNRLGSPFQSTFRPHETLTTQVLAGIARAVGGLRPDLVIQGGDLIDNAQSNELEQALAVLRGGDVEPGSGPHGYFGVQLPSDPDPFYYRPDLDAPRHPGLLLRATTRFRSDGMLAPTLAVLGDHDILVAGEIPPSDETRALALGEQAVWELPAGLSLPSGVELAGSADGPLSPYLINDLLARALAGAKVRVPGDPRRRELAAAEVVAGLRAAARSRSGGGTGETLDYAVDVGRQLRLIVLDLARRGGGSGGLVSAGQPDWVAATLRAAGERWVIAISHQPLASSENGEQILALLDQHPKTVAAIAGHTHRNEIVPRPTSSGGYWLINTASLIDYPQQARAIRVRATSDGGVAIQSWMVDHTYPGDLGEISRQLSYLDAQGGRPRGFAGTHLDRNVTLFRR